MFEKIQKIIALESEIAEEEITEEMVLLEKLDSMEVFSLVSQLEEEFDIEISDRDISRLVTVHDVVDYLEKKN